MAETKAPTVVATANIQFSDDSSKNLHASIEVVKKTTNPDKLYVSNSKFKPGETAYLLVYLSPGCSIKKVYKSMKTAAVVESGKYSPTEPKKEFLKFTVLPDDFEKSDNEASLSLPAVGGYTYFFMGDDLGSLTLLDDGKTFRAETKGIGIASFEYTPEALVYKVEVPLQALGTEYEIMIVMVAEGPKP
jgi:hypothetical protein